MHMHKCTYVRAQTPACAQACIRARASRRWCWTSTSCPYDCIPYVCICWMSTSCPYDCMPLHPLHPLHPFTWHVPCAYSFAYACMQAKCNDAISPNPKPIQARINDLIADGYPANQFVSQLHDWVMSKDNTVVKHPTPSMRVLIYIHGACPGLCVPVQKDARALNRWP